MKRILILFFLLIVLVSMISCSPTKNEPYKIYLVDYNESNSGANHFLELDLSNEITNKVFVEKTKIVNVFGEEYEVTYKETKKRYLYNCEWDCYEYSDDRMGVFVNINSQTGNIDYCSIAMKEGYEKVYTVKLSQEKCQTIAQNYLSAYVDDVESYQIDKVRKDYNGYRFSFSRYIGEFPTCDGASITVNFDGEIETFQSECMNELKNAELPSDEIIDEIKTNIDKKLDEIYEDLDDKYEITYGKKELIFTRFADGKYGFEIFVDVTLASVDSDTAFDESNHFVVYIG